MLKGTRVVWIGTSIANTINSEQLPAVLALWPGVNAKDNFLPTTVLRHLWTSQRLVQ